MNLLDQLENSPGNTVVYSEAAWACARKATSGDIWFPDSGSHHSQGLNSFQLVLWTSDWAPMEKKDWA